MIALVFAAMLQAGAPAAAQPPAQPAAPPAKAAKAKPGPNDMVCKHEAVLGSRMKERICMTQGEWDQRQMQDREDLNRSQTQQPLRPG
jgi:predicted secreted protein